MLFILSSMILTDIPGKCKLLLIGLKIREVLSIMSLNEYVIHQ